MRWMDCASILCAAMVFAASAHAGPVRDCTPADINSADGGLTSADLTRHQLFHVDPIIYDRPTPMLAPLVIRIVVGVKGEVDCFDNDGHTITRDYLEQTPQRQALFAGIGRWRYKPFRVKGAPARVVVKITIPEKVELSAHENMPRVPLDASTLTLTRAGAGLGAMPQYSVTLHGDGSVIFNSTGGTDVVGEYHYQIPKAEISALIKRLRAKDVWSAAGHWFSMVTDSPDATIIMTFGDQTHSIYDHVGENVGMPHSVTEAEKDIDLTAHTAGLIHLSMEGVAILDQNQFDFKSTAGADLLMRAIVDANVSDDAIMAVLDRDAPVDGGNPSGVLPWRLPPGRALDAALSKGRTAVAQRLMDDSGPMIDDKRTPARVDRASQKRRPQGQPRQGQGDPAARKTDSDPAP